MGRTEGVAFLSIFLIAGLGADVVLVFVTFWEVPGGPDRRFSGVDILHKHSYIEGKHTVSLSIYICVRIDKTNRWANKSADMYIHTYREK